MRYDWLFISIFILILLLPQPPSGARIPGLYYNYANMAVEGSGDWWTYDNVMLIVIMSVVPIALSGQFWSLSYMLFRREFTACPGK